MKKIPTLFVREFAGNVATATPIVTRGCEWVIAGEGTASRKRDGMAILVRDSRVYKRYDAKVRFATAGDPDKGRVGVRDGKSEGYILKKPLPLGFEACCDPDGVTGHWPGWVPVGQNDSVIGSFESTGSPDGTYELCGPSVGTRSGKNPERLAINTFFKHGGEPVSTDRSFDGIKLYLAGHPMEGIVWRHADGRMVKIKARDFGLEWPR